LWTFFLPINVTDLLDQARPWHQSAKLYEENPPNHCQLHGRRRLCMSYNIRWRWIRYFPSHIHFQLLTASAFFIVKDMNFHPRYDKQTTTQKLKASETSPSIKRIRLVSPSPVKRGRTKADERSILSNSPDHSIDMVDDAVSPLLYYSIDRNIGGQSFFIWHYDWS
jgi:hypothetical protein